MSGSREDRDGVTAVSLPGTTDIGYGHAAHIPNTPPKRQGGLPACHRPGAHLGWSRTGLLGFCCRSVVMWRMARAVRQSRRGRLQKRGRASKPEESVVCLCFGAFCGPPTVDDSLHKYELRPTRSLSIMQLSLLVELYACWLLHTVGGLSAAGWNSTAPNFCASASRLC